MLGQWNEVFYNTLGKVERTIVQRADRRAQSLGAPAGFHHRRRISRPRQHQPPADRDLRRTGRRGRALQAGGAASPLRRAGQTRDPQGLRGRHRGPAQGGLKPWREVITPHPDVASGRYQQAEFAADLGQVYRGEGSNEYRDPGEFFRRTFLTEGLQRACSTSALRAPRRQGRRPGRRAADQLRRRQDPLDARALPPLLRHAGRATLPGIEPVLQAAGVPSLPEGPARRAGGHRALARPSPGKPDGTDVAHLVGRAGLAALGGEGYELVAEADRQRRQPGLRSAARAVQAVRALPDPDRRVGRLRPPALRRDDLPAGHASTPT